MLRIQVFDRSKGRNGKWTEIENGPFPITVEQLEEARRRYKEEWANCPDLSGVKVSPQTTARAILHEVAPLLTDFDAMMVGFAVSNDQIRTEEDW